MGEGMPRRLVRAISAIALAGVAACLIACTPVEAGDAASAGSPHPTASTPAPAPTSTLRAEIRSSRIGDPAESIAPTDLQIPSLGVDMTVVPVGIAEAGQMELPEDPAIAGWYRFGPDAASTSGNVVLAAHVDSVDYPIGPLADLRAASAGDPVVVAGTDGSSRTYVIESLTYYEKTALPTDQLFQRGGPAALVIITCGGPFDSSTGHYRDNVVAVARPQ